MVVGSGRDSRFLALKGGLLAGNNFPDPEICWDRRVR